MRRRQFLTSSLAAPALAAPQTAAARTREFYELRRYRLQMGEQRKVADAFLHEALIPALNRLAITPVGVFSADIGPDSPSLYVLMPSLSVETLVTAEFRLEQDAEYLKAGAAFLNAAAKEPAYARKESSLLAAFEGWPRLTIPAATAEHR